MIESINEILGIENDVSVPTLISLIVFIIGGLVTYLYAKLNQFSSRQKLRRTFGELLNEVIRDTSIRERHAFNFFPTITPKQRGGWSLPHNPISYLDTLFELDFSDIYFAFRKKFFWHFGARRLSDRAFHKVWALLRHLKYMDSKLEKDIDNLTTRFGLYHKEYGIRLDKYRKYHDELGRKTQGVNWPKSQKNIYDYLKAEDKIWYDWQQLDEKERVSYDVTYAKLVKPMLDLNRKNPHIAFSSESDDLLLACTFQYIEIENTLNTYMKVFKNYYFNYRVARRILNKCSEIIV